MASPIIAGGILYGVSTLSSTDVWAAGTILGTAPLIEHWDGTAWTVVQQGGTGNELRGISAVSSSDVWAVGNKGSRPDPFIEHWDGTSWSVVPTPSPGRGAHLYSVSALAPNDVWAAGSYTVTDGTSVQPLFLHWDGVSWTQDREPLLPFGGIMFSVDMLSADDGWAVGYQGTAQPFVLVPLIEHWDGRRWRPVPGAPIGEEGDNILISVAAVSNDDVWAVGMQQTGLSMAQHWDGTSWTNVAIPNAGTLWGAWAESTSSVWAVGNHLDQETNAQASSEHWDGGAWDTLHTPHPGPPNSQSALFSVISMSGTDVWAVGDMTDPVSRNVTPLTMHSRGVCP